MNNVTALEKMRTWLATFPAFDILSALHVDYTDQVPSNGGIFPSGLVEVERRKDIFGSVTITNQYNFGMYYVLEKADGDDMGAAENADWVMDFQQWVQEQSAIGKAPTFGDEPRWEKIIAQNGMMYETDNEGTALYMIQLSVEFKKKYEVKNKWMI